MSTPLTPRQAAKKLNDHHMRTCAGFYGPGYRFFGARVHNSKLEVTPDFGESWIDATGMDFRDHNGRAINL